MPFPDYQGNIGPLSMTNMLNSHASNGQLSISYLPERPDQPECRYFMNHGTCKYGSECKYHHPREKQSELTLGSLGPLGLPIRPVSCFILTCSFVFIWHLVIIIQCVLNIEEKEVNYLDHIRYNTALGTSGNSSFT